MATISSILVNSLRCFHTTHSALFVAKFFITRVKTWLHARENYAKSSIWHENTTGRSNLREFKWSRLH